jgi:phage/plasmid-associated DNA primase
MILFFKLSHDYPTRKAARRSVEALVVEVRKRVVDDVWGLENGDFFFLSTNHSYASDVEDRCYFFVVGDGNNGKGVWVDLTNCAFEGRTGNLCNKSIIYSNNNSGDTAKALPWMVAPMHLRIMAISEVTVGKGVVLDNNAIKKLSNGCDTFCRRQKHKDGIQFNMDGTRWAFANDLPEILNLKTADATHNRVVFIEMCHRYLEGEK